jgi:hypothetical protein
MSQYRKLFAALVGGALQIAVLMAPAVPEKYQPLATAIVAVLTAISVYAVPNVQLDQAGHVLD